MSFLKKKKKKKKKPQGEATKFLLFTISFQIINIPLKSHKMQKEFY